MVSLKELVVDFYDCYGRPPSTAELVLMREAMASKELDRDQTHAVE